MSDTLQKSSAKEKARPNKWDERWNDFGKPLAYTAAPVAISRGLEHDAFKDMHPLLKTAARLAGFLIPMVKFDFPEVKELWEPAVKEKDPDAQGDLAMRGGLIALGLHAASTNDWKDDLAYFGTAAIFNVAEGFEKVPEVEMRESVLSFLSVLPETLEVEREGHEGPLEVHRVPEDWYEPEGHSHGGGGHGGQSKENIDWETLKKKRGVQVKDEHSDDDHDEHNHDHTHDHPHGHEDGHHDHHHEDEENVLRVDDIVHLKKGQYVPADAAIVKADGLQIYTTLRDGERTPTSYFDRTVPLLQGMQIAEGTVTVRIVKPAVDSRMDDMAKKYLERDPSKQESLYKADLAKQLRYNAAFAALNTLGQAALRGGEHIRRHSIHDLLNGIISGIPCAEFAATSQTGFTSVQLKKNLNIDTDSDETLEKIERIGMVVSDLTVTLTTGVETFKAFDLFDDKGKSITGKNKVYEETLWLAASLDQGQDHPLSQCLVTEAQQRFGETRPLVDHETLADAKNEYLDKGKLPHGLQGKIHGKHIIVGNERTFESLGLEIPAQVKEKALSYARDSGATHAYARVEDEKGTVRWSCIASQDKLRPDAIEGYKRLREDGIGFKILTGASKEKAYYFAKALGMNEGELAENVYENATPEAKAKIIKDIQINTARNAETVDQVKRNVTLFACDGYNDMDAELEIQKEILDPETKEYIPSGLVMAVGTADESPLHSGANIVTRKPEDGDKEKAHVHGIEILPKLMQLSKRTNMDKERSMSLTKGYVETLVHLNPLWSFIKLPTFIMGLLHEVPTIITILFSASRAKRNIDTFNEMDHQLGRWNLPQISQKLEGAPDFLQKFFHFIEERLPVYREAFEKRVTENRVEHLLSKHAEKESARSVEPALAPTA